MNPFLELNNKLKDQEEKITKREFMATHLMSGLVADPGSSDFAAKTAVEFTDKLIAELNKPRGK